LRRVLVALGLVVVAGAGVAAWFVFFRGGGKPAPIESPAPRCASAELPGHLGKVAWVVHGRLDLVDLDTCARRTLVRTGASGPVRFSPDGRWIAYGEGNVLLTRGGTPGHPLGRVFAWGWGPSGAQLVGVSNGGDVELAQLPGRASTLQLHGATGASTHGENVAVASGDRVKLLSGSLKTLYSGPRKTTVHLAGFSPDGRWVLFWDLAKGATAGPLDAAPVAGGGYHNVFDPVPAFDDFLTWCGRTLVASGGGREQVSEGQQLLVSRAPDWRTHNLSSDFRSSWTWPSCSPDGREVAVTIMPNHTELSPGEGERRIEVISIDGTKRVRLRLGAGVFEAARWSSNGKALLVVHRRRSKTSEGTLELVRFDRKSGKVRKAIEVADLGTSRMPLGHADWMAVSDWFRG
jgi:Tol biopolymer transport system component